LKIFVPIACLAFTVMAPVNWTNRTLEESKLTYSDIDKLSISNIPKGSNRFFTHLVMAYAFTFWTCYILKREYAIVAKMRLHFIASEQRRPDQFTVNVVMATSSEIGLAAAINILTAFAFLVAFAILRIQPFNDRVYFPKWYLKGLRNNPLQSGAFVQKFVNLDLRSYLRFLNWMPAALRMPEPELIDHAGLDCVVYLRIYLTGFVVILVLFVLFQNFILC
nr:CSC1-like protein At3g21620 [Tanacetum cinerariifolium]